MNATTPNDEPCEWVLTRLFEQQYANLIDSDDADLAEFDESEIDACFAYVGGR